MNPITSKEPYSVEELHNSISESVKGVMYTYELDADNNRKLISMSDGLEKVVGKETYHKICGDISSFIEVIHPDDHLLVSEKGEIIRDCQDVDFEFRLKVQDNTYRWMRSICSCRQAGDVKVVTGVLIDIHDFRMATEYLFDSETKFRLLLKHSNDAMYVISDGRIIMINKKFTELTGYSEEDINKEDFDLYSIVAPRSLKYIKYRIERYKNHEPIPSMFEFTAITKDNREVVLEASVSRIQLKDREVSHIIVRNITQRAKQARELNKLYSAVNQSENLIVVTDLSGVVEYVNPHFMQATGYTPEEIVGKNVSILKSGETSRELYRDIWETIHSGKSWSGKIQNKRKNGEIYWETKTITPIMNEHGEICNYLSVGSDITKELLTQEKLIASDKISAIGTLAAGVAHEFKNYLGGIIGNASLMLDDLNDQQIDIEVMKDTLKDIINMGDRANDVAMSLLTFSKAKSEDRRRENIKKIVLNSLRLVEKDLESVGIHTITHFEHVPDVEVSASKIQQILLNLLINAKHAISQDGVITVAVFNKTESIEIRIGDSGGGINKDLLNRIFDPFFSTKGVWGSDEVVGTGMGLAICRNLIREHHGDLTVNSLDGLGTTFTLSIPVKTDGTQKLSTTRFEPGMQILIFSLDKNILAQYYPVACEQDIRLITADNINHIPADIADSIDMVIFDSKFSGKIELYKAVQLCNEYKIPYSMVNSGAMEYQLTDLYYHSLGNFKALPDFNRIIHLYQEISKEQHGATEK